MSHFQGTVVPATFCEVTYDSDWFEPDDRHLTPYRYSLMRNDTDSNSDTVSLTLPSYTYYEYLRSLYDCRTTPCRAPQVSVGSDKQNKFSFSESLKIGVGIELFFQNGQYYVY